MNRLVIDGVTLSDGDLVLVKNNYDKKDDAGATIWSGSDLYLYLIGLLRVSSYRHRKLL